jgi:osmotically-inducible protein OsmY
MSETVKRSTPHQPPTDDVLFQRVNHALARVDSLQLSGLPILVRVRSGVVRLRGAVGSASNKETTLQEIRSIPGVAEVHDELFTDADLEARIMGTVSSDPRTRRFADEIVVNVSNGRVLLTGHVTTHDMAQAAGSVAAMQSCVRSVSNRLTVTSELET